MNLTPQFQSLWCRLLPSRPAAHGPAGTAAPPPASPQQPAQAAQSGAQPGQPSQPPPQPPRGHIAWAGGQPPRQHSQQLHSGAGTSARGSAPGETPTIICVGGCAAGWAVEGAAATSCLEGLASGQAWAAHRLVAAWQVSLGRPGVAASPRTRPHAPPTVHMHNCTALSHVFYRPFMAGDAPPSVRWQGSLMDAYLGALELGEGSPLAGGVFDYQREVIAGAMAACAGA